MCRLVFNQSILLSIALRFMKLWAWIVKYFLATTFLWQVNRQSFQATFTDTVRGYLHGGGPALLVGLDSVIQEGWIQLSKKCWSRQPLSCVRSFDLLALLGGPAILSAFIWKISSSPRRDLGWTGVVNSEIPP